MAALFALFDLYRRLDDDERTMANDVIAQWVLAAEESTRYDAIAMVREFRITSASAALKELAWRLVDQRSPGASFELDKVRHLLAELRQ